MPELCIDIISQLLVYKFITELLGYIFCYGITIFRFKNNIHEIRIASIRLLMDIK